ncbi:Ski complex subunit Rec14 [Sporothrix stenoceras]|uniref:Large ribosomal subunit protein bL32m n=1 Tax=Sporothrix stenoceras TaxID=5173 RepID=A0ABR3YL95_9PEZI
MAAAAMPFRTAGSASILQRLFASSAPATSTSFTSTAASSALISSRTGRIASLFAHRLAAAPVLSAIPAISLALPSLPSLPSLLGDIWESILRAVPKKKTSHSKKRSRQMAGKALKDVTSLCKCPACGRTKRMHRICPHCMETIRDMMKKRL